MVSRPDHLEWVYVYVDANLGKRSVGYVGRSKNLKGCLKRLRDHRRAKWYSTAEWNIALCPCLNRCESEHIETLLINSLAPKWNIDKVDWGANAVAPKLDDMIILKEDVVSFPNVFYEIMKPKEKAIIDCYVEYNQQFKEA